MTEDSTPATRELFYEHLADTIGTMRYQEYLSFRKELEINYPGTAIRLFNYLIDRASSGRN